MVLFCFVFGFVLLCFFFTFFNFILNRFHARYTRIMRLQTHASKHLIVFDIHRHDFDLIENESVKLNLGFVLKSQSSVSTTPTIHHWYDDDDGDGGGGGGCFGIGFILGILRNATKIEHLHCGLAERRVENLLFFSWIVLISIGRLLIYYCTSIGIVWYDTVGFCCCFVRVCVCIVSIQIKRQWMRLYFSGMYILMNTTNNNVSYNILQLFPIQNGLHLNTECCCCSDFLPTTAWGPSGFWGWCPSGFWSWCWSCLDDLQPI